MTDMNTPGIETDRLILRQFTAADTPALFELLRDEEVNRFLPWFPLTSLEQAEEFLRGRFLRYYDKPSAFRCAVCLKEEDWPIGYVWLSDGESHDFGYALKKEYWRKGLVTEASMAVIERIRQAGYPYITATHDVNNPRSGEVIKKLGMAYKYSYLEQWQPKNIPVTFRMYQLNFDGRADRTYLGYWDRYETHFIESDI